MASISKLAISHPYTTDTNGHDMTRNETKNLHLPG